MMQPRRRSERRRDAAEAAAGLAGGDAAAAGAWARAERGRRSERKAAAAQPKARGGSAAGEWWRDAVLYHLYVRSFADSDGDGVGDLPGVASRLSHLRWLGVDAVWLSPTTVSPDADYGYDVSDYRHVQAVLGGDGALRDLIRAAHATGIRVLLDLVPNHTSIEHPWFLEARRDPRSPRRSWYVWAGAREDGGPPNNWMSDFRAGGAVRSAWSRDPRSGQWYLSSFLPEQVDLNWRNPEVRAEFLDLLDAWFRSGVDGVRIDVAHKLAVDEGLRDNPALGPGDDGVSRARGQRQEMNAERPELHDILRSWRRLADAFNPPRLLLGETYVGEADRLTPFLGGDELHLALNVPFLVCPFTAPALRSTLAATFAALPERACPLWCASSHDAGRFPTRWCGGDERLVRCALLLLLTLPGTPLLYYGDEIGMPEVEVPDDWRRDRGARRDPSRTPMQWAGVPGGGFTRPGVEPWLPLGDCAARSVAGQMAEAESTLQLCRRLIAARRRRPSLRRDRPAWLAAPPGVLAWRSGEAHAVALNLSGEPRSLGGLRGRVAVATEPDVPEPSLGSLSLPARSGALLDLTDE
jgi:alpha-glucosidase